MSLTTVAGSKQITVAVSNHGARDGDYVLISNVNTAVGGVPASEINTNQLISNVTTNTFTITVSTTASSSTTYNSPITFVFDINAGQAVGAGGYGWSTGTWGRSTWGSGMPNPVYIPPRLYTQDRFNNNLIFCIRNADIYYWTYDPTFTTRAVLLSSVTGATSVPQLVGSILFSQQDGHLIAFGGTNYLTNTYDPLLIRWANQNEPWNFAPTATNSAGFLRVTNGSEIIRALRTRQEILVYTDSTLYSLQYLGTEEVFGLQQLSDSISLISPSAVTAVNNVCYWMGQDKFYVYNGRVDTLSCTLRQHIFQDINRSAQKQVICGTNEQFNEVIWFYPSANSAEINKYVIYNHLEDIWYYGTLDRTAWLDSPMRDYPQAVRPNGLIYDHERGTDDDTLPMAAFIASGDVDIEDGDQYMLVRRVIPDVNFSNSSAANPTATITISPHNFPGAAYQTDNVEGTGLSKNVVTTSADIDLYTNQVFLRARGRQMSYKISSDGLGVQWQQGMPRIDVRPDGRRS